MELSVEARNVITLTKEQKLLDASGLKMLEQLFAHRINQDLAQQLVIGRERSLAKALFAVAACTHAAAPLGYVLRFLGDLCQLCPSLVEHFADPRNAATLFDNNDPARLFSEIADANRQDPGVFCPALFLVASVLRRTPDDALPLRKGVVAIFLNTVSTALTQGPETTLLEHVMMAVCEFLRNTALRTAFRETGLIPHLPRLLSKTLEKDSAAVVQLVYEALLAMRLLSFDYDCIVELHSHKAIPVVHRALQMAGKEKCIRMALYVFHNFARAQQLYTAAREGNDTASVAVLAIGRCNNHRGPAFFSDMVGVGVLKTLHQYQKRKFGDDDIPKEITALAEVLDKNLDAVTSFSEYRGELQSGVLEWSPVHTSTKFWKENAKKFDETDVLAELSKVLLTSTSDVTLAVASHDFGELVRYHPAGRSLLEGAVTAGVKERIMHLMSSEHADIAKNALGAVQKILVDRS